MLNILVLLVGLGLAGALFVASTRAPNPNVKKLSVIGGFVVLVVFLLLASTTYVPSDRMGVVSKNWLGKSLRDGKIIATNGEMGVQADVLPPGLHFGYWPFIYTVSSEKLTVVDSGSVGLIETVDGVAMDEGQLFAPEWSQAEFDKMLEARHFLTAGNGRKGKQVSVLKPGTYRLNPELYRVKMVEQTEILQGEVGVLKANFGKPASLVVDATTGKELSAGEAGKVSNERLITFAREGEMGVRRDVLRPGKYPINTDAFTVVEVFTSVMISHYTAGAQQPGPPKSGAAVQQQAQRQEPLSEEREIRVTTSDGFKFPVDVRVEYEIDPANAPVVVASLGDDEGERFRNVLNSAVRAIFRNNAEKVRALDYVQQRSQQESQSLTMLSQQIDRFGVNVTAVRIGDVGDESSLGSLLKTQTDRELAKQEQTTFQEQQKAAEQKKQLARTQQESDEEKKLATANYAVKIAAEEQKRKVTEAEAEAKAIEIKALAQAKAYEQIAQQIGKSNAATLELLKIVGEKSIQITPRIFVSGGQGGVNSALAGTLLDHFTEKSEEEKGKPGAGKN